MANAIVIGVIVLAAVFAARKQFRKGQWIKSCVGCTGHCSGSYSCSKAPKYTKPKRGASRFGLVQQV